MKILTYIAISLAGLLSGAVAGALGGFLLGWLFAFGYHKRDHGSNDAPAYVALGLMILGAALGAVVGLVVRGKSVDAAEERKARELVKQLSDAGVNSGLLVVQGAVVLRGPGAPYAETPMLSFNLTDLQNAIDLGLLVKANVTGSYEWEWAIVKK